MSISNIDDFSFFDDFQAIRWGQTLWFNLVRSMCAAVMLAAVLLLIPDKSEAWTLTRVMPLIVVLPIAYLIYFILIVLPLLFVRRFIGGVIGEFINFALIVVTMIMASVGDPLLSLLYRVWPGIVPTNPPFFSLRYFIWVLDEERLRGVKTYS
jgi:hypothetical protein